MEWVSWAGVGLILLLILVVTWIAPEEDNDQEESDQEPSNSTAEPSSVLHEETTQQGPTGSVESREPGQCPICGTVNDPFYTFCRECVAPLR